MRTHVRRLADVDSRWPRENDQRGRGQHPGLLLQRFLAAPATGDDGDPEERKALLKAARAAAADPDLLAVYRLAFGRWSTATFPDGPDGPLRRFADLKTAGRLVVGLGAESVLETGLRLHHTYGLPVIPGPALKGLANHYCDTVWGQRHLPEEKAGDSLPFRRGEPYHDLLFGHTRTDDADAGAVVFHDAWLLPDSAAGCLCQDVMTPHHQKWQIEGEGQKPPTDFDSPIPVSFLSVAGTFRVGVSWAGPLDHPQAKNWTELAFVLLTAALAEWGVGGKTSSGYGRLVDPKELAKSAAGPAPTARSAPTAAPRPKPLIAGNRVTAVLLGQKSKKGGWRARLKDDEKLSGPIQNSGDVPADKAPDQEVELIIASVSGTGVDFKWPK